MPYKSGWYVPERIYYFKCYGELTQAEVRQMTFDSAQFVRESSTSLKIYGVTDLLATPQATSNLKSNSDAIKEAGFDFSRSGYTVIITPTNPIVRFMTTIMGNLFGTQYRLFNTLEEGLQFLNDADPTLPALLPPYDHYPQNITEMT